MALFENIRSRIQRKLQEPNVPVNDSVAGQVATQVAQEIVPVIENATNKEPWFRSRIYLGLITAVIGMALSQFGVVITSGDVNTFVTVGGEIIQALGVLYATYGRIIGSRSKPIGV